jgi:predicted molibdopterin-dependent oxidoreductase YjgC
MNVIISEDLHDKKYIEERTEGFEALKKVVEKYTPKYTSKITGVPAEDIKTAARMYAQAKAASILYTMGITQHTTGVDNVKSCANLAMICGNIGIEGGGVNPLRGQNNVQGACDMGGLPNVFTGYQPVTSDEARAKFEKAWGVSPLPPKPGLTIVETLNAAHEGKVKALYVMGENPMISDPDLHHAKEALSRLDLLIVQDIFLSETAQMAHVVLPPPALRKRTALSPIRNEGSRGSGKPWQPRGRPRRTGKSFPSLLPGWLSHEVCERGRYHERNQCADSELRRSHLRPD